MSKELMGQLSVTGSLLKDALTLLTHQQRADLADRLAALITSLNGRWPVDSRSDFQRGMMDEYERVLFRLRQMNKVSKTDEASLQKFYFLCIKCDIPVIAIDADTVCPGCGTVTWFELVHT